MITARPYNYLSRADGKQDCSLGNILFTIAGIIGVATKNHYTYGFEKWANQEYFVNQLPKLENKNLGYFQNSTNYKGFDIGFRGFNVPDNVFINGYFGSKTYFEHCDQLIRRQFIMKDICLPIKDTIFVHYRDYSKYPEFYALNKKYYEDALSLLPKKRVIVVTDNIPKAFETLQIDCEYTSNSPIIDFYLLAHADYVVMANSTFSWWGSYLSNAKTIAPKTWFDPNGDFSDCPIDLKDFYCKEWMVI